MKGISVLSKSLGASLIHGHSEGGCGYQATSHLDRRSRYCSRCSLVALVRAVVAGSHCLDDWKSGPRRSASQASLGPDRNRDCRSLGGVRSISLVPRRANLEIWKISFAIDESCSGYSCG